MCGILIILFFGNLLQTLKMDCNGYHQENHDQNLFPKPKVLVLEPPPVFKYHEDKPSQKFHFLKAWDSPLPLDQFLTTHAHSVQAILSHGTCPVTNSTIRLLPSLGLIVTTSSGLNQIDLQECRRRGVSVAYAGSLFSADVADIAVGLLIDALRKISAGNRYVTQGLWANNGDFSLGSKVRGPAENLVRHLKKNLLILNETSQLGVEINGKKAYC
jgi:hydroxypyruvate reductase 2